MRVREGSRAQDDFLTVTTTDSSSIDELQTTSLLSDEAFLVKTGVDHQDEQPTGDL